MKRLVKAIKKVQSVTTQENDHVSSLKLSAQPFYSLDLEFESDGSDTTMYVTSKNLTKTLYANQINNSDVANIESKMEDIETAFYELTKELKKLGFKI